MSTRSAYYQEMEKLALKVRAEHGLTTPRVLQSHMRSIYRHHGIRIDLWPPLGVPATLKDLRGAYFDDEECGPSVMLRRDLPEDPMVFTMAHELKHHLQDRGASLYCASANQQQMVEIGAEVFAAELLFPTQDFHARLEALGAPRSGLRPEHVVRLKRATATTLSYAGLAKRAEFYGYAQPETLTKYKGWRKLEQHLYGEPVYKRILRARQARRR